MIRLFFSVTFILFLNNYSYSNHLEFKGFKKLNINDIQALTSIDIFNNNNLDENKLNLIINELYNSELIYNLNYYSKNNHYYIDIEETKIIKNVFINGNVFLKDDQILSLINSKPNNLISKEKVINDEILIRQVYASRGFDDISISSTIESFSNDKINLLFEINEGKSSKIIDIKFFGNNFFSSKYLSKKLNTKKLNFLNFFKTGSNLNKEALVYDTNIIKKLYSDFGFFSTDISYMLDKDIFENSYILKFYINEGNRFKINNIYFNYNDEILKREDLNSLNTDIVNSFVKNDFFYDSKLVSDYINNISSIFKKNNTNFYFEAILDESNNLSFVQQKGDNVVVNEINIYGNSITKDNVIRSFLSLEPGDYLNEYSLSQSEKKLNDLKFINYAKINSTVIDNIANLDINIEENNKTGSVSFAGFISGDTGLGLSLALKDSNFLGSGNEFDVSLETTKESLQFKLAHIRNYYNNPQLSNRYLLANEQEDLQSSFGFKIDKKILEYGLNFEYNDKININNSFSYNDIKGHAPITSISPINDNIGLFNNFVYKFSINYNSLNDFLYPTNGQMNNLFIEFSPENISDNSYFKVILKNSIYKSLQNSSKFLFINNNLGFADSFNGNLKTLNSFALGGLNFKGFDFRGVGKFDGNIYLGGNNYFTSTIGFGDNFLFDENDNINYKLFSTIGSVWGGDYAPNDDFKLRSSVGLSFDILTPIAPISFSYATVIQKEEDDRTREFNFSIGTSF